METKKYITPCIEVYDALNADILQTLSLYPKEADPNVGAGAKRHKRVVTPDEFDDEELDSVFYGYFDPIFE